MARTSRQRVTVAWAVLALGLAGCGTASPAPVAAPTTTPTTAPTTAPTADSTPTPVPETDPVVTGSPTPSFPGALDLVPTLVSVGVRPNSAWTVSKTGEILVYEKNRSPTHLISLPAPARSMADIRIAHNDTVWASWISWDARQHDSLSVAYSTDTGRHWSSTTVDAESGAATADIVLDESGPVTIVTRTASNTAFSSGAVYVRRGLGWAHSQTPIGGELSIDGASLWLAGGAGNNQLWVSRDGGQRWLRVDVPGVGDPAAPDAPRAAVSAPTRSGGVLTLIVNTDTHFRFLTSSDDGHTWVERAADDGTTGYESLVPPHASTGASTLVIGSPSTWRFDPHTGALTRKTSTGLAFNPQSLFMSDESRGVAFYAVMGCRSFKADCATYSGAATTTDGGSTWSLAALPPTK